MGGDREGKSVDDGNVSPRLTLPAQDRRLHRLLIVLVRFRAWLLGSVYTAGALAVITRGDGRLLLVKPWYRRGWGLPGGFMKPGEQCVDALRRELLEETGIEIEPGPVHEVYVQRNRRHIEHLFVLRVDADGNPRPTTRCEIADVNWHDPDHLPPLQREAHDALERVFGH